MKRKVLISLVGIALFAVAIGLGSHESQQEKNLIVKNTEALADEQNIMLPGGYAVCVPGDWCYMDYEMKRGWRP